MKKKVYLRCSSVGNILTEGKGNVFSEKDSERIDELKYELENGINKNGNKVKWTPTKAEELKGLVEKRDKKPELSETAKTEVENIWLMNEKGYYNELDNKYLTKGLLNEQEALSMVSELEGEFYIKNTERREILLFENDEIEIWLTGEPDWVDEKIKRLKDTKCSWSVETFMNSKLSSLYKNQLQGYGILFDVETLELHYCLTDCPDHLVENEIWKARNRYGILDPDDKMFAPIKEQIMRNLVYSNNPAYTLEEMVKTYVLKKDPTFKERLIEKAKLVAEYYLKIKLNQQ